MKITDENWANQIPTASGVGDTGPHHLDLVHRRGTEFTFFELKVGSNHPLYAGVQLVQYGVLYVFSRCKAQVLGYDVDRLELLRATGIRLSVLAPWDFYSLGHRQWLSALERTFDEGIRQLALEILGIPMEFRFETLPERFRWDAAECGSEAAQKELLWALHGRHSLFPRT